MYAQSISIDKFINQTIPGIKVQIDFKTILLSDFNTWLSPIGGSSRLKKIYKGSSDLNGIIDQLDLTDIYRIFHTIAVENTFFTIDFCQNRSYVRNIKWIFKSTRKLK
jgi:hypothetical protein